MKITTEGYPTTKDLPAHVIGLTEGGRDTPIILLDTHLGIIHWLEGITIPDSTREMILDKPEDYAPKNERNWKSHDTYAITDFFEVLKDDFKALRYVPINWQEVKYYSGRDDAGDDYDRIVAAARHIYQEHGWPDQDLYSKDACLRYMQRMMVENFPDGEWPVDGQGLEEYEKHIRGCSDDDDEKGEKESGDENK